MSRLNLKENFDWRPLLFLLFPIWSLISGLIPGFLNMEYDVIAAKGNTPIGAGEVGLFQAYMYSSSFVKFFFFLGLISAILIGIYGVLAAFFPLFRRVKIMVFSILALLVLQGVGYVAGGFLLANYVERFSIDFFTSQGRIFDDYNALTFMNLNLLLSMAIPAIGFVWWIWVSLVTLLHKDKDQSARP